MVLNYGVVYVDANCARRFELKRKEVAMHRPKAPCRLREKITERRDSYSTKEQGVKESQLNEWKGLTLNERRRWQSEARRGWVAWEWMQLHTAAWCSCHPAIVSWWEICIIPWTFFSFVAVRHEFGAFSLYFASIPILSKLFTGIMNLKLLDVKLVFLNKFPVGSGGWGWLWTLDLRKNVRPLILIHSPYLMKWGHYH